VVRALASDAAGHGRHETAGPRQPAVVRRREPREEAPQENESAGRQLLQGLVRRTVVTHHHPAAGGGEGGLTLRDFQEGPEPREHLQVVQAPVIALGVDTAQLDLRDDRLTRVGADLAEPDQRPALGQGIRDLAAKRAQVDVHAILRDVGARGGLALRLRGAPQPAARQRRDQE